ncbi:MAG: transcriptional regulator, partial [Gammaproteobacteria bacterium]
DTLVDKSGTNYCLTGTIDISRNKLILSIELSNLIDQSIIWMDRIEGNIDDIHQLRSEVVNKVISALEIQISAQEAKHARLKSPQNLDAWSSYHLGLDHMYRFTVHDNLIATKLFETAIKLEPSFARAHAGLSFAQFQRAFNRYPGTDIAASSQIARASAERSIELDHLDPFANFVMGRSCWLDGSAEDCLPWIERAVSINPNYAHGYYVQGLAALMSNKSDSSHSDATRAISQSPLDPLLYAFYGLRAFSYIAEGNFKEAQIWAERAARQQNAVPAMDLIALVASSLAGSDQQARYWDARFRKRMPVVEKDYFFRALPFSEGKTRELIHQALAKYGL